MDNNNKKLIIFPNRDKDPWMKNMTEEEKEGVGIIRPSARICISGPPHSGKSLLLFNLIINSKPFDKIYLYMADEQSQEYEKINYELITDISQIPCAKSEERTLIILEDLDMHSIKKTEISALDKTLRYGCSHYGTSLVILTQNLFSMVPGLRRKISVYYFFGIDQLTIQYLPITKNEKEYLRSYIKLNSKSHHDNICVDLESKHKFRYNVFTVISP